MGDIIGVGLTHYPPLAWPDRHMADVLRWTLEDPAIPNGLRSSSGWPEPMAAEYGSDGGTASAAVHRKALLHGTRRVREAIEGFRPDVLLVWGDDQYEIFNEECVPAFSVLAFNDTVVEPWAHSLMGKPNVWGEDASAKVNIPGAQVIGKHLAGGLIEAGFDVAYAYRPGAGAPFPHAFLNTVLFLDYDRSGFTVPVLPLAVNCYGRHLISRRGGLARFAEAVPREAADPPSPSPKRCFELGAATARILAGSPWRVALAASSSWSHAFLCDNTWRLHPDRAADRRLYDALVAGDVESWRSTPLSEIEEAGQQEMLNWFCLVGAVTELGLGLEWSTFVETWVFNSNKCFAVWR